jgi:hypothetical protein
MEKRRLKKVSSSEERIRQILRSELQSIFPQPIPQSIPRPIDDGEALEKVMSHMTTCTDPTCNVNRHLEGFFENNYKGCPECGKIVKKEAKVCKHCHEEIEAEEEEED